MSLAIVDKNKHWKQLEQVIKNLSKIVLKVGIQKDAGVDDKGNSIAEYGTYNEYGVVGKIKGNYQKGSYKKRSSSANLIKIPARSFLRSTTDENNGWKKEIEEAYTEILEGKTTSIKAMSKVGIRARDDIVTKINKGDPSWPPNADSTIKKKKSSRPLIDKGFLKKAIQYQFEVK